MIRISNWDPSFRLFDEVERERHEVLVTSLQHLTLTYRLLKSWPNPNPNPNLQAIEIMVPGEESATDTALLEAVKEEFQLNGEHFSLISSQNAKLLLPSGAELKAEHIIYSGA